MRPAEPEVLVIEDQNDPERTCEIAHQDETGAWRVKDDVQSRLSAFLAGTEDVEEVSLAIMVPGEAEEEEVA